MTLAWIPGKPLRRFSPYTVRTAQSAWHIAVTLLHISPIQRGQSNLSGKRDAATIEMMDGDFEHFIRLHERQILNYLWRIVSNEASAYDLTQEVFLRAWQHFKVIRQYDQPRAWLFRVATNLALTHLKRRSSPIGSAGTLENQRDMASSDPSWRLAERDLVRETLLQLPPKRRAALVLREVYGMSAAETAKILDMSETAVRMALHRGREQFRLLYLAKAGDTDGR
jgi:RNA polymerase sigma-70 factor, ECF subfamily